jgi:hypothetical protein
MKKPCHHEEHEEKQTHKKMVSVFNIEIEIEIAIEIGS